MTFADNQIDFVKNTGNFVSEGGGKYSASLPLIPTFLLLASNLESLLVDVNPTNIV